MSSLVGGVRWGSEQLDSPVLHPEAATLRGTERSQPGADTRRWAAAHLASPEACCCHSRQLRLALRELAAGCLATRLLHTEPATHVCRTLAVAPTNCIRTQSCTPPCTHTCTLAHISRCCTPVRAHTCTPSHRLAHTRAYTYACTITHIGDGHTRAHTHKPLSDWTQAHPQPLPTQRPSFNPSCKAPDLPGSAQAPLSAKPFLTAPCKAWLLSGPHDVFLAEPLAMAS